LRFGLGGTRLPLRRAFERPIAMACLRLFTLRPERPECASPRLYSCISFSTSLPEEGEYFLRELFLRPFVLFLRVDFLRRLPAFLRFLVAMNTSFRQAKYPGPGKNTRSLACWLMQCSRLRSSCCFCAAALREQENNNG